jgi:hypothetical protein
MRNRRPTKRTLTAVVSVLALSLSLSATAAQAGAHGFGRNRHHGIFGQNAIVSGVITAISGGGDQFTATASVAPPGFGGSAWRGGRFGGSPWRGGHHTRSHCDRGATTGTPDTTITTNDATTFDVNGTSGLTIASLAVGDTFTATFAGTPGESLADIVANPALSVTAQTPNTLYAFVGTVTATDTTSSPETVSVSITGSTPTGLFTGTDTFDVGPGTFVLGGAGGSLLGSLSNVAVGDVVAGGLVATGGQTAAAIEADPLRVLVDFPAGSSSSAGTAALRHLRRTDLDRAMRLLRKDRARFGGAQHKKHD